MSKYSKYVVTELKEPEERKKMAPVYNNYAKRILWMDKDVVPGAFNMNASWYLKASETIDDKPHTHDHDEIIGFFSNDASKQKPWRLSRALRSLPAKSIRLELDEYYRRSP